MTNKISSLFIVVLAFALVYLLVTRNAPSLSNATKETTYERVMRTKTIRCGYFVWPPYLNKDMGTGKLSGLYVDYMDALSAITNLKIEWTEEANFGTYLEDIASGRYDMECAGGYQNAKRGQVVFYPKPYAYIAYVALARADDHRFDGDPSAMNDPSVKIATMDGEMTAMFRGVRFPQSQDVSLPQNASSSDLPLNVATGKADVTFSDIISAEQYIKSNPGKIKILRHNPPLYLIALTPTLPQDERLKQMIDVANEQLLNTGVIDVMLRKYETKENQFLRVAAPFR